MVNPKCSNEALYARRWSSSEKTPRVAMDAVSSFASRDRRDRRRAGERVRQRYRRRVGRARPRRRDGGFASCRRMRHRARSRARYVRGGGDGMGPSFGVSSPRGRDERRGRHHAPVSTMTPSQSKSRAKRASTVLDAAARTARRAEREVSRGAPYAEMRCAAAGRTEASAEVGMASASVGVRAPTLPCIPARKRSWSRKLRRGRRRSVFHECQVIPSRQSPPLPVSAN